MPHPTPTFHSTTAITLTGVMAIYNSQADASAGIPLQWQSFLAAHPELQSSPSLCGASPCTPDHKIHYLTGVILPTEPLPNTPLPSGSQLLTLEAGEYAVVHLPDPSTLRDT